MLRSEMKLRNQFYVLLVCFAICQFGIWYVLLTDDNLSRDVRLFFVTSSLLALACFVGLGYCYFSVRKERLNYKKMLQEQQAETNALIDEIQSVRSKMTKV